MMKKRNPSPTGLLFLALAVFLGGADACESTEPLGVGDPDTGALATDTGALVIDAGSDASDARTDDSSAPVGDSGSIVPPVDLTHIEISAVWTNTGAPTIWVSLLSAATDPWAGPSPRTGATETVGPCSVFPGGGTGSIAPSPVVERLDLGPDVVSLAIGDSPLTRVAADESWYRLSVRDRMAYVDPATVIPVEVRLDLPGMPAIVRRFEMHGLQITNPLVDGPAVYWDQSLTMHYVVGRDIDLNWAVTGRDPEAPVSVVWIGNAIDGVPDARDVVMCDLPLGDGGLTLPWRVISERRLVESSIDGPVLHALAQPIDERESVGGIQIRTTARVSRTIRAFAPDGTP